MSLTRRELDRLRIVEHLVGHHLTQAEAAVQLGLGVRQTKRLVAAYRRDGPVAIASRRRGKPSNRRIDDAVRRQAIELVQARYADFGPTLAAEKLASQHDMHIDHETLRRWLVAAGLREPRQRRARRVHQPRDRRPCRGELIQIDGSHHLWLEDRGPRCTLLVAIDDATSALMALRLERTETREGYFRLMRAYLQQHGRPIALYSDAHSIFRTTTEKADGSPTQFGRAMDELGIELICAASPQAKGRVERVNATLQDRLVKELRLREITTIDAANAFLETYRCEHNSRFAVAPTRDLDVHRPLDGFDLERILCVMERRTVSRARTISYDNRLLLIDVDSPLRGRVVDVRDHGDGRIKLEQFGRSIRFCEVRRSDIRPPIIDHKQLREPATPWRPPATHPWKQGYKQRAAAAPGTSLSSRNGT